MKTKRYALKDGETGRRDGFDLIIPDSELDLAVIKDLIIGDWLKSLVEQTGRHDPWEFSKLLSWGDIIPAGEVEGVEDIYATIDEAFVTHRDHPGVRFAVEIMRPGVIGHSTQVLYLIGDKVYYDFVKAKETSLGKAA